MKSLSLTNAEYRFACIVWENEPIESPELVKICEKTLGWKRTTMYTVLKRLCDRGVMKNERTVVTSILKKDQIQNYTGQAILADRFDDRLPLFIARYLNGKKLTSEEAEKIKLIIDSHMEKE